MDSFPLLRSPEIRRWGILWLRSSLKNLPKFSSIVPDLEPVAWHTSVRCLLSHQAAEAGLPSHQINLHSRSVLQPIYFQLRRLGGSSSQVLSTWPNSSLTFLGGIYKSQVFGQLGPNLSCGNSGGSPATTESAAASLISPVSLKYCRTALTFLCCLPKFIPAPI